MNTPPTKEHHQLDHGKKEPGVRPAVRIVVWGVGLACVGILMAHQMRDWMNRPSSAPAEDANSIIHDAGQKSTTVARTAKSKPASGFAFGRSLEFSPAVASEGGTQEAGQLVHALVYLNNPAGTPLTEADAAAWKDNLQRLIQQGDQAVPAIRDFLLQNQDVSFGREGAKLLGYSSARLALLDALAQIGSSHAVAVMDETLQTTMSPQEIALMTQFLEKSEPGNHLQHAFDAAQRILSTSSNGNLAAGDMAPLFQVLQQFEYGNAYTVPVLKDSAGKWNYYAAIALARLPEGAGVPALVDLATSPDRSGTGERLAALQALSSLAAQSSEAQDILVNMARRNQLSASDWTTLGPFLAGSQMVFQNTTLGDPLSTVNPDDIRSTYIPASNQSIYMLPSSASTADQIKFIDQLLAITADPVGRQVLQQSKSALETRSSVVAKSASVN